MEDELDPLFEQSRLRTLEVILRPQGEFDREFDRLSRLGSQLLNVPVCLVSLVTSDRQIFKGACGLPENLAGIRQTPISHSLCKFAVVHRQPFVVTDGPGDTRVANHPAITDLQIRAYLGFPLMTEDGQALGSFCAIDFESREWSDEDMDLMRNLAALAVVQLEASTSRERARNAVDLVLHDLKSPMGGIVMASCLLNEALSQIPPHLHPLLQSISEASTKALKLIDSLAEADQAASLPVFTDAGQIMAQVTGSFAEQAEAKGIHLHLEIDDARQLLVPDWVLTQILENLASNAIKFSPPGARVTFRFINDGRHGHIDITDGGPGFTEEDRKRLYKRYSRLSATPTGGEVSTGLGLSIVKRLATQYGGSVELVSGEGESARFRVSFPME